VLVKKLTESTLLHENASGRFGIALRLFPKPYPSAPIFFKKIGGVLGSTNFLAVYFEVVADDDAKRSATTAIDVVLFILLISYLLCIKY